MKKRLVLFMCLLLILTTGCVENKKYSRDNTYIKCYFGKLPESLDSYAPQEIYSYLFSGLVSLDKSGKVVPSVAEDWQVSSDGLKYIFKIRNNACWSDGNTIKAEDFVELFKMLLQHTRKDSFKYMLYPIAGAEDYSNGNADFDKVGVKANDEKTLEINLTKACPEFIRILSQPDFTLRKDEEALINWQQQYNNIIFSGPFTIGKMDSKQLRMDRNAYYWNSDSIKCKSFFVTRDIENEEALADFEMGDIDILANPPISEVGRYITSSNTTIINKADIIYLAFNTNAGSECSNIELRKKICNGIDRNYIKNNSLKDFQSDVYGLFNIAESTHYSDIDNSKLDKAMNLTLFCSDDDMSKAISKDIKYELKKNLNINLSIRPLIAEEIAKENKDFDIILEKSLVSYDSSLDVYRNFASYSLENLTGYKNKAIDSLISNSLYEDANNKQTSQQCYDILSKDAAYAPLFNDSEIILKNSELSDIGIGYFGDIKFDNIYK